eukprot:scaffold7663_cov44-Prasinocladus_malaysianus.AAC.1
MSDMVLHNALRVPVVEFVPKEGLKIETDPKATETTVKSSVGDDEAIEQLCEKLKALKSDLPS